MKKGYFAIAIAVLPWGFSFLNTKIAIQALGAMTLCFSRFLIALVIISIVAFITKKDLKIKNEDIKYFLLAGGVGITVYFYFENNGVKYIDPSAASLLLASMPIATIFSEALFDGRKLDKKMIIGGLISLIGVGIIMGGDINLNSLFVGDALKGYLMMFGAILSWVVYSFYQFLFGVILAFPFIFIEKNSFELVNNVVVFNVLMLGVFSSAIGFFAFNYSMKVLGVSKASLFINFIPLVTIIASYFYYGTFIGLNQVIGGIFIIGSVLINREDKEVEYINTHRNVSD